MNTWSPRVVSVTITLLVSRVSRLNQPTGSSKSLVRIFPNLSPIVSLTSLIY